VQHARWQLAVLKAAQKRAPYYYIFRFANPLLKIHRILKQTNFEAPSNFYGMSVQDIENSVENKNTAEKI
jgi:hypothetical protein